MAWWNRKKERTPEQCKHDETIALVKVLEEELKKYDRHKVMTAMWDARDKLHNYYRMLKYGTSSHLFSNRMRVDDLAEHNDPYLLMLQMELVEATRAWHNQEKEETNIKREINRLKESIFK